MGFVRDSQVDYWLTDDGLTLLECWARDGLTDQEMALKVGVTKLALRQWRETYPEIAKALATGREIIDYKVENALLKAALGYTTKEVKVTLGKKVIGGETVQMLKETTTKEVAPNVMAAMFWLNNREFDKWKRNRDKVVDLDEQDNNISITIVRGNNNSDGLGSNVNNEVKFEQKPGKAKKEKERESDEMDWEAEWDDSLDSE